MIIYRCPGIQEYRNTVVNFERIVKDNLVEDILSIRGDDNAMTLFSRICTFAKEYSSNVEFALAQTGAEGPVILLSVGRRHALCAISPYA